MALDVPLPRRILSHGHWTLGRKKMAKSTGNVVNPFFALERFGADTMRYYLAHDGGIGNDTDYDNLIIIERYKKGLHGGLGNLASRTLRGKRWNVRRAISSAHEGVFPEDDSLDAVQRAQLDELSIKADKAVTDLNIGVALRTIMHMVYEVTFSFRTSDGA